MAVTRTYSPRGRNLVGAGLALAYIGLMVMSPDKFLSDRRADQPIKARRVTRVEPQTRGWVFETLRVYSVLKSHYRALPDFSAWRVAKAITAESRRHDIDPMLILAVIKVESRFRSNAVSPRGAVGLMQILPVVARSLAEEVGHTTGEVERNLHDPALNLRLGTHYLMRLKKSFGDMRLALIAYNRGPSEVRKRLREKKPLPAAYVDKVIATRDFFNELTPPLVANKVR